MGFILDFYLSGFSIFFLLPILSFFFFIDKILTQKKKLQKLSESEGFLSP
jgi:hypothetical protein